MIDSENGISSYNNYNLIINARAQKIKYEFYGRKNTGRGVQKRGASLRNRTDGKYREFSIIYPQTEALPDKVFCQLYTGCGKYSA
ncbi:MAG: hypothetical protein IJT41_03410 [Clostridia bacterium]|nr:hypothetical protein [Clostridia bacterium]